MALHFRALLVAWMLISSASIAQPPNRSPREITLDSMRVA
jgi:hypothetical protein